MAADMEDRKRCQFWLPKKKRFCANLPFPNSTFCGNHTPRSDAQWIPCPIDSSHSVLQENLESHVKRCPMLKQSQSLSIQPFYQKGINAGQDKDDGVRLSSASNENTIQCSENVTAEMKRNAVHGLTLPQFYNLISKIKSLHESVCKDIVDSYRTPEACDKWIKGEVDGKVPFQEKHVMQQVSILGNLEELGVLKSNSCVSEKRPMDDDEEKDVPAVVEFGAGRGYLTELLADCYGVKRVFLVERKSYKLKADRSLRQKESLVLERLRIDIEDLNLSGVESLKGLPFMAIGKHLCGPATDLTLRCCLAEEFVHSNHQKCRIKGIAIATCCHHLCQWKHYTNKRYLLDLGIDKDEFHAITWFTSWAVDADHGSDLPDINNGSTLQQPSSIEQKKPQNGEEPTRVEDLIKEMKASERAVVGFMCKQIIDFGRLMWVKEHGLVGRLVKYVPSTTSPENHLLVAKA